MGAKTTDSVQSVLEVFFGRIRSWFGIVFGSSDDDDLRGGKHEVKKLPANKEAYRRRSKRWIWEELQATCSEEEGFWCGGVQIRGFDFGEIWRHRSELQARRFRRRRAPSPATSATPA
ncbi:hypothetical protein U1Q18_043831 [Sarracenia purpurea var. burkii]